MFSGHDSTFYPLLAVLEFTDLHYPPYASHLEMELWQADSGDLFVRILHNGVEVGIWLFWMVVITLKILIYFLCLVTD